MTTILFSVGGPAVHEGSECWALSRHQIHETACCIWVYRSLFDCFCGPQLGCVETTPPATVELITQCLITCGLQLGSPRLAAVEYAIRGDSDGGSK
jgi:hypothetical protein